MMIKEKTTNIYNKQFSFSFSFCGIYNFQKNKNPGDRNLSNFKIFVYLFRQLRPAMFEMFTMQFIVNLTLWQVYMELKYCSTISGLFRL